MSHAQSSPVLPDDSIGADRDGAMSDDLGRDVYCLLGMPVDRTSMASVLAKIEASARTGTRFLISTPNLNFLVSCQTDPEFRESLYASDLCAADGIPIIWIARLLGVPVSQRVAGSDMFHRLQSGGDCARPLKVYLFGGAAGVAAAACQAMNGTRSGVCCVGAFNPGFCAVEDMSTPEIIERVNASGADFLLASLGAKKGQAWLLRNHDRFSIPIRAHLGAVLNFQAGTVRRSPVILQKLGLEWLWRIKEEPYLWKRYWADGWKLVRLMATNVLPLAVWRLRVHRGARGVEGGLTTDHGATGPAVVRVRGEATEPHIAGLTAGFRSALALRKDLRIDLSDVSVVDFRFLGLLLMVRKQLKSAGRTMTIVGLRRPLKRVFRLSGLESFCGL